MRSTGSRRSTRAPRAKSARRPRVVARKDSAPIRKAARIRKPPSSTSELGLWLVALGVVTAVVLVAWPSASERPETELADASSVEREAPRDKVLPADLPAPVLPPKPAQVPRPAALPSTAIVTKAAAPDTVTATTIDANTTIAVAAAVDPPPAGTPAASAPADEAAPVTITGCLEAEHGSFRLTDTRGGDAPKSRSWRSGFLMKRPATIQLVDGANMVNLPGHIGKRIAVTGTIVDREMQARRVHRVAASC